MLRTRTTATALLAAAGLALGGCAVTTISSGSASTGAASTSSSAAPTTMAGGLAAFYAQKLDWKDCKGRFQCASLTVPIDYAQPTGPTMHIAVLKAPAFGGRIASLVVNPGGPGGSGVQYAQYATQVFTSAVTRSYDVVGFDPRGVGQSQPIVCEDGPAFDHFLGMDPTPDDPAEIKALAEADTAFGAACKSRNAAIVGHVSTEDAARDMDVLRAALGDAKLSYFGASYGTFLGATYADLFPTKVGRMVLDGAIDPKLTGEQLIAGQAGGFEKAYDAFLAQCVHDGGCPLGSSVEAARATTRELLKSLDHHPLDTHGIGPAGGLNEAWASFGIAQPLYDKSLWGGLKNALDAALRGDGGPLMQAAMQYADRNQDGSYSGNMLQVINAVNCLDRSAPADPAHYEQVQKEYAAKWPTFGPFMAWSGLTCGTWPIKATGHAHAITAPGSAPIVVVGTTRDPATPYEEAVSLAHQLQNGILVSRDGDGHTGYHHGNQCVDTAVDNYLVNGTPPAKDTSC